MTKLRWHTLLFTACLLLSGFTYPSRSLAAIGIFNWYARSIEATIQINYFLNVNGDSGSIEVYRETEGVPGPVVRTLVLSPADLTKGPHAITWDGKNDTGSAAPQGTYFARIRVHAAPVPYPSDPLNPLQMPDNRQIISSATYSYYGVAADLNPENNNQSDPSKSTYGLIYAANPIRKCVEVYFPDGTPKTSWGIIINYTTIPWTISVGEDGHLYTVNKTYKKLYNFTPNGTDMLSSVSLYGEDHYISAAWGKVADGTARCLSIQKGTLTGKIIEWPILAQPVPLSSEDPNRLTNFDSANKVETVITPGDCTQTAKDTSTGNMYIAQYNNSALPSLRRYTWTGTSYMPDDSWIPDAGPNVTGVSISRYDPNILLVCKQNVTSNLERWYIENPDPDISGPSKVDSYKVANLLVHNVVSDARGNAIFDANGLQRDTVQSTIGMFIFPDNGSEDVRIAGPFDYQGPSGAIVTRWISEIADVPHGSSVTLESKVVSGCFGNVLYIQEPERAAGIKIESNSPVSYAPGTLVNVTGTVDRLHGQKRLINAEVTQAGSTDPPRPLAMATRYADNDPSQKLNFIGVNNLGLLVRTTGKVTSVDLQAKIFYLDDGCGLNSGIGCKGLAVSYQDINPPLTGDFVAVTGLSSTRTVVLTADTLINGIPAYSGETVYEPTLLPRTQQDLQTLVHVVQ